MLPQLEYAVRRAKGAGRRPLSRLLAVAYQAAAAAFAQVDDPEAAWVAADRSIRAGEDSGQPLQVIAGMFRMAHAFLRLQRLDLAEHVATSAAGALADRVSHPDCPPEDAGEALEAAAGLDVSGLSAERQAHFHLDLARAHTQRRHLGEATVALLAAERLSPEQIHTHASVRDTIYDLLSLSGRRPTQDLQELAQRCGAIP